MKKFFKNTYLAFIFLIFYTPIFVLMLFSFNGNDSVRNWSNWSWHAYKTLFNQSSLWQSVSVTLIVAFISTFVAVIIGTFAALGLSKTKKLTRNLTLGITNIPLVNADIVTAVSLMLLFMAFGFSFGILTLILAHISFNIPYVIITVLPKIRSINISQLEASQDLGATPWYTLRKIVLPTIKPAIIAGAAIAFAMSFDDFLISYFTGGNTSNVSTFIYSLKRIKPYVNAFSTIIILLITVIIISWNAYVIVKKQLKHRNEEIAKGFYYDKKIIKTEKMLFKCYLQLNNYNNFKKGRKNKKLYNNNFAIVDEEDIIKAQEQIKKNPKLIAQIDKLENKLEMESIWIQHIKNKISEKKSEKEERSKLWREKYRFLLWPWKMIMITIIIVSSFICLGAFYLYNNTYDLAIANWGEYINTNIIRKFEKKYQVKIKYNTFDDNESLYAKLYTTKYDLMVPSDYMVAKLAHEDRILQLATTEEDSSGNKKIKYDSRLDFDPSTAIDKYLYGLMENYPVFDSDGNKSDYGLNNYSIPYFWGDIVLLVNKHTTDLNELGITDITNANWNILQIAAAKKMNIVLNNDMHNLFMPALAYLNYTNVLKNNDGDKTSMYRQKNNKFHDNINVQKPSEIEEAKTWLKPISDNPNTKLLNDNIVDEITNKDSWNIAMMYNGDLLSAISDNPNFYNDDYLVVRPFMGTNVWTDNMVISKNSQHQGLAFKFINFIMTKENQIALSSEFGYTSPLINAMNYVSTLHQVDIWKHVYLPNDGQIAEPIDPKNHPSAFFNDLYTRNFDSQLQTGYNQLLAR